MLVVTRRPGETIRIGGDITIMVTKVRGDTVHIGITAPDGVVIDREEVHERRRSTKD